jgi:thiamine-monophosphate kinase
VSGQTVREIGEFGLISALRDALPPSVLADEALKIGIGDDAAVWTPAPGESLVVTTDSLVERIHFRLDWTDWRSLGHKSLAANVSDIAAMGAKPALAVLSLGLRGDELVEDLRELYRGVGDVAERYGVVIAGGDIVASPEAMSIHVTAFGESRGGRWLTRSGARPGDAIAVSGTLGASAAGYRLLRDGGPARNATTADLLISAHLAPEPRVKLGALLLEAGATSAMDLSDGLFGDLPKILVASNVGAVIDAERIPVPAAVRALFPNDWFGLATRGGEDYELLLTILPDRFADLKQRAAAIGSTVTAIGEVVESQGDARLRLRGADGLLSPITSGAFDHFA